MCRIYTVDVYYILLGWLISKPSLVKLSSLLFVSRLRDFLGLQWASDKKFCRAEFEMFIENHFHVRDMIICLLLWETSCALNEDSEILTFLTIQKLENYQTPIIMHHNILTTFPCLCHSHFLHGDKSGKESFSKVKTCL